MNLSTPQIDWINDEYTRCNRTIEEISLDTGKSISTIKRALAERGVLNLPWHKSEEQHKLLTYLHSKGIKTVADLGSIEV